MSKHYLLDRPKGSTGAHMVLDLEPNTRAECERAIRWQHQPAGHTDFEWVICTLENGVFVNDAGDPVMVHSTPYTAEAWEKFCRTYGVQ